MSAKRTRAVTVRPGRDFALSRVATRSARWNRTGRMMRSVAGFLPSADCAPAELARRCGCSLRGSRFHGSAESFSPAAGSEQLLQRPARGLGQLADCDDADFRQPRLRFRADAPHQFDRQIVQEGKFGRRIDEDQPVRLRHLRGDLRQMFGAGDAN
jgi:hypothetical protein